MHGNPDVFCNGKPPHMERFLEVCLLMVLYNAEGYGYGLVEQLEPFGFAEEELNISTLYRTLRKMEKRGSVTSLWERGGPGPKRRVYEITEEGRKELNEWVRILRLRKSRIEILIARYDKMVNNNFTEKTEK